MVGIDTAPHGQEPRLLGCGARRLGILLALAAILMVAPAATAEELACPEGTTAMGDWCLVLTDTPPSLATPLNTATNQFCGPNTLVALTDLTQAQESDLCGTTCGFDQICVEVEGQGQCTSYQAPLATSYCEPNEPLPTCADQPSTQSNCPFLRDEPRNALNWTPVTFVEVDGYQDTLVWIHMTFGGGNAIPIIMACRPADSAENNDPHKGGRFHATGSNSQSLYIGVDGRIEDLSGLAGITTKLVNCGDFTNGPILNLPNSLLMPKGYYVLFEPEPGEYGSQYNTLVVLVKDRDDGPFRLVYHHINIHPRPVADAGADQTVDEGTTVTLDGSGTRNLDDSDTLSYFWTQTAGPAVILSDPTAVTPTFTAPSVARGGATLTFQLTVRTRHLSSAPDIVNITVTNVNHVPVAVAGAPQTVQEGSVVTLDGTASYDPDDDPLTYLWGQTEGPGVTLDDATTATPAFVAPPVDRLGATLTFQLTVSDGLASDSDTVTVTVEDVNHAPTANAGANQTRDEGSQVTLDGTASRDPDNDPLTYAWTQVSGPAVTLDDATAAQPSFEAPLVNLGGDTLVFGLVVSDGLAESNPAEVTITVQNVNDPPVCHQATASPAVLWPPNHKLAPVRILGVSDPDDNQVTLTVTGVTQDEPVNGLGDGDTSPDATLQGGQLALRAERAGTGNGRVYQVSFTADDGQAGTCTGGVTVCVPRDPRAGTCGDEGKGYNSLQP